ncbi:hypothetical protein VitviT2T_017677 [Vitis vinifera]|uniref:Uncharacterized protein n=2 Tax=Vitis vinifera TaxID=29760 RepID=A0ABY9CVC7_VITVI|nr:hypothetical protein VitviT2T_017677 [Vitis vinifera]|eukprot:XP_010656981.1 PREDICTED: protein RALF-like 19 [Vitis vinifera]
MDIRLLLVFLILASPLLTRSSSFTDTNLDVSNSTDKLREVTSASHTCNGLVGECIDEEEEEEEMMGDEVDIVRRSLAQRSRFISYGALKKNNVPCNRRGNSYYNCARSGKANPYRRGCSAITHCQRYTS